MQTAGSTAMSPAAALALLAKLTEPLKMYEYVSQELEKFQPIGEGCAATVYRGRYRGEDIAIKEMLFDDETGGYDEAKLKAFHRELDVWRSVEHEYVLKFKGMSSGIPFVLCSELCMGGTLFDLLHNCWHIPVNWTQRMKMLRSTASALEYLHTLNTPVIHRDLKSLNVLLMEPVVGPDSVPQIRLADFGFARFTGRQQTGKTSTMTLTKGAGTFHWMAPEVAGGVHYHKKVDVFSFAVIMYEVVCRRMAFEDLDPDTARERIIAGDRADLGPDFVPEDAPPELVLLITHAWQHNPKERPDFSAIVKHLSSIQVTS